MLYRKPLPYCSSTESIFAAIADLPWAVWLDSGGRGRYDILAAEPVVTVVTRGMQTHIADVAGARQSSADPFVLLRELLGAQQELAPDIKFAGGALGYWAYDLSARWSKSADNARAQSGLPEMAIGLYDWAIQVDHQEQTACLVSYKRYPQTAQNIEQVLKRLESRNASHAHTAFRVAGEIVSNFSRSEYAKAFGKIQAYIKAGDCYQVNLAQRYSALASGDVFTAYCQLRKISPAPYSVYMNLPFMQILCTSPERFLQVHRGAVETRPIKGTRPRVEDIRQNEKLLQDLQTNPKDRAENLMIVDLLRNDLGKSCEPGSVQVPSLFELESFTTVHHLVSTITGKLAAGKDALALLRDCFPGGSVTGAPKHRAMEIIEELEPNRRGVYCGSLGYIGFDGNMDSNIAIRTLVYADGEISFYAGGGIVADSVEPAEYQETLDKSSAMLALLKMYGGWVK